MQKSSGKIYTKWCNGIAGFEINGEWLPAFIYNGNRMMTQTPEGRKRMIRYRQAGVRLFVFAALLREEHIWRSDGSFHPQRFEQRLRGMIEAVPDAKIILFIDIQPPAWWVERYPEELTRYASGKEPEFGIDSIRHTKVPSFASLRYREECGRISQRLIERLENSPAAENIIAYHFNYGVYSEWHGYGMLEDMPDVSPVMNVAFRRFLLKKYHTDKALQQAWKDSSVTLDTAEMPGSAHRLAPRPSGFLDPAADRRRFDAIECYQRELFNCQMHFNAVAKQGCGNAKLVGNYSGYFFGMRFSPEAWHLYTPEMVDSPLVDYQASPYCYIWRRSGESGLPRSVIESYRMHGKLNIYEADTRVWFNQKLGCCYSSSTVEDVALLSRDFCHAVTRGAGIWYYDFREWWFDRPEYLDLFRRFGEIMASGIKAERNSEIAVLCDFSSIATLAPAAGVCQIIGELNADLAEELHHAGAPFDTIFSADILRDELPAYKVVIIASATLDSPILQQVTEKLKQRSCAVLWIYAPGAVSTKGFDPAGIEKITGFKVEAAGVNPVEINFVKKNLPLLAGVAAAKCSGREPVQEFYLNDPDAEIIASHSPSGRAAAGIKRDNGILRGYLAHPAAANRKFLRNFLKEAGVHIYDGNDDDIVFAAGEMVGIHSAVSGIKHLQLPHPKQKVIPLLDQGLKSFHHAGSVIDFEMEAPATVLFRLV